MPFFPQKFFADTAHVPGDVAAYYMVLLAHAWERGGSLPDDDDQLRLMTRCHHKRWPQIRTMVLSFWFVGDDGRLHQKRLDKEWGRAATWRQNQGRNASPDGGKRTLMRVSGRRHNGTKPNDINATPPKPTRARALTHTHTEKNSLVPSESSSLARAALCVRPHASPALRLIETTELSPPPPAPPPAEELTAEQRAKIAEGLARLAASISGVKNLDDLDEAARGTKAELETRKAEEKLNALANAEKPVLALSPLAKTSPLVADYENAKTA